MRHPHHPHRHPLILDPRHHAGIADASAPVADMLPDQRAADRARVVEDGDALFEGGEDARRDLAVFAPLPALALTSRI